MATQADVNMICELAERSLTLDEDEIVDVPVGYDLESVRAAFERVRATLELQPLPALFDVLLGRIAVAVQQNAFGDEWTLEQLAEAVEEQAQLVGEQQANYGLIAGVDVSDADDPLQAALDRVQELREAPRSIARAYEASLLRFRLVANLEHQAVEDLIASCV